MCEIIVFFNVIVNLCCYILKSLLYSGNGSNIYFEFSFQYIYFMSLFFMSLIRENTEANNSYIKHPTKRAFTIYTSMF